MKLYHGTTKEAAKSIIENGFDMTGIETTKQAAREYEGECFYGFNNYDDAEDFAFNQGYDTQAVLVFEVDDSEVIADTEYTDSAYVVIGEATNIEMVWSQEY
jgi:hypothetical protein